MKTLIINGSPRPDGNTVALINEIKKYLEGEVLELSAFRSNIAPCVDCRCCWKTGQCVVKDDMQVIYDDNFDNIVIASPVYFGTMPGQMLSLMSRLQPWHAKVYFLGQKPDLKKKKAAAILTAGGKHNEEKAYHHLRAFFKMVGAIEHQPNQVDFGTDDFVKHVVTSVDTDRIPAIEDEKALYGVKELAAWLNEWER